MHWSNIWQIMNRIFQNLENRHNNYEIRKSPRNKKQRSPAHLSSLYSRDDFRMLRD